MTMTSTPSEIKIYSQCSYCGFYGPNEKHTALNGMQIPICKKCLKEIQKANVLRCRLNYSEVLQRKETAPILRQTTLVNSDET